MDPLFAFMSPFIALSASLVFTLQPDARSQEPRRVVNSLVLRLDRFSLSLRLCRLEPLHA